MERRIIGIVCLSLIICRKNKEGKLGFEIKKEATPIKICHDSKQRSLKHKHLKRHYYFVFLTSDYSISLTTDKP